jgi:hypothetical protein
VQYDLDASQNRTWPVVTGVLPAVTVAVSVTALPDETVVCAFPPEIVSRLVVVGDCAAPVIAIPLRRKARSIRIVHK